MLFAIVIGMIGGTVLTFLWSRWLVRKVADRFAPHPQGRSLVAVCALVFGAIALAPAIFLSVMGVGSLGERLAQGLATALGMGGFFGSIVLTLEVVAVTVVTVAGHAAFGAGLGALAARSLRRPPPGGGSPPRTAQPG